MNLCSRPYVTAKLPQVILYVNVTKRPPWATSAYKQEGDLNPGYRPWGCLKVMFYALFVSSFICSPRTSRSLNTVSNDGWPLGERDLYSPSRVTPSSLAIFAMPFERAKAPRISKRNFVLFFCIATSRQKRLCLHRSATGKVIFPLRGRSCLYLLPQAYAAMDNSNPLES